MPKHSIPIHYPTLVHSHYLLTNSLRNPKPDLKIHTKLLQPAKDSVYCLKVRGRLLISGSRDRSLRIWRLNPGLRGKGVGTQKDGEGALREWESSARGNSRTINRDGADGSEDEDVDGDVDGDDDILNESDERSTNNGVQDRCRDEELVLTHENAHERSVLSLDFVLYSHPERPASTITTSTVSLNDAGDRKDERSVASSAVHQDDDWKGKNIGRMITGSSDATAKLWYIIECPRSKAKTRSSVEVNNLYPDSSTPPTAKRSFVTETPGASSVLDPVQEGSGQMGKGENVDSIEERVKLLHEINEEEDDKADFMRLEEIGVLRGHDGGVLDVLIASEAYLTWYVKDFL